jgi:hypothetical protein
MNNDNQIIPLYRFEIEYMRGSKWLKAHRISLEQEARWQFFKRLVTLWSVVVMLGFPLVASNFA